MATYPYGTVYFQKLVAGTLQQVPDGRYAFTYEKSYLDSGQPQIAYTLARGNEPIYSPDLPAFFDNLVAEGWLARAQARALGINGADRFGVFWHSDEIALERCRLPTRARLTNRTCGRDRPRKLPL